MIDADVIIRGEKGLLDVASWVESLPLERFEIAAITIAELWHGVERASGQHKQERIRHLEMILAALPVIDYTEDIAREHARIWAHLEAGGKRIVDYDMIVAAVALNRGSGLATFHRRHFECVPGLRIIEPA